MMESLNQGGLMRNFTAYILRTDGDQRALHLLARDKAGATLTAKELALQGETVLHVVEQGDW